MRLVTLLMLSLVLNFKAFGYEKSYHMIGDSIFSTLNHKVARDLSYLKKVNINDHSVSGAWMSQIAEQYTKIRNQADVIIMDGGGNDVLGNSGNCRNSMNSACKQVIDNAINELRKAIKMMEEDEVETFIFLGVHYPKKWSNGYVQAIDYAYSQLDTVCNYTTFLKCEILDGRQIIDNDNLLEWDGVHPNNAGAYKIAQAMNQVL